MRVHCCCCCVCGWDAADNGIGEAGAVALAKALESGQCTLESLNLQRESTCLAACALLGLRLCFRLHAFR